MPIRATRLPLSPHCNPFFVSLEQPRCFPPQSVRFFSLFCSHGFREQRTAHAPAGSDHGLASHPPCPPQGRLHLHTALRPSWNTDAPHCRFIICFVHSSENTTMGVRLCTRTGLHGNRVGVTMPLEIALSSQARKPGFPPAPTQHWAYQAGTRGFIDVPFRGFLGPP